MVAPLKSIPVIVLAIVIVVGLALGGFRLLGEVIVADTTTHAYDSHHTYGAQGTAYEVLDSVGYVTCWVGRGASEKIVAQGTFESGSIGSGVERYWWVVTVEGTGDVIINYDWNSKTGKTDATKTWTSEKVEASAGHPNIKYPTRALVLTLGGPCSGKITMDLWAHHYWNYGLSDGDDKIQSDQAYLKSGIGKITAPSEVVEEEENAVFTIETAYSHSVNPDNSLPESDSGWYLRVVDPAGMEAWKTTVPDNFGPGPIVWKVPVGMYSTAWNNTFTVQLRNELVNQDQARMFVIGAGMRAQIPNKPSFDIIAGGAPFKQGDEITIRISSVMNPIGNAITSFTVSFASTSSTGQIYEYIFQNAIYPAQRDQSSSADTYFTDVQITFPEQGYAKLWASAVDAKMLNSGDSMTAFSVAGMGPPGDDENPPLDVMVIVAVALIILAVLAAMFLLIFRPIPFALVIGVGLLVSAVVGVWYVWAVML